MKKAKEYLHGKLIHIPGHTLCGEPHYAEQVTERAVELAYNEGKGCIARLADIYPNDQELGEVVRHLFWKLRDSGELEGRFD